MNHLIKLITPTYIMCFLAHVEYKVDYQFTFDMGVPLTNMTRRLCIDVGTIEDMVLEEMEIATLLVYIDFGSNVTATIPITCIFIIDNDGEHREGALLATNLVSVHRSKHWTRKELL